MDFYFSLPDDYTLPPKITLFDDVFPGQTYTAQTFHSDGRVEMSVGKNTQKGFVNIDVLSHELGHTADFMDKELHDWYYNYGIKEYTQTSGYASKSGKGWGYQYEHLPEFISNYAYDDLDEYGNNIVSKIRGDSGRREAEAYRAAAAIMWYKNVWRPERVAQIFKSAGVGYTPEELKGYMRLWRIEVD